MRSAVKLSNCLNFVIIKVVCYYLYLSLFHFFNATTQYITHTQQVPGADEVERGANEEATGHLHQRVEETHQRRHQVSVRKN